MVEDSKFDIEYRSENWNDLLASFIVDLLDFAIKYEDDVKVLAIASSEEGKTMVNLFGKIDESKFEPDAAFVVHTLELISRAIMAVANKFNMNPLDLVDTVRDAVDYMMRSKGE